MPRVHRLYSLLEVGISMLGRYTNEGVLAVLYRISGNSAHQWSFFWICVHLLSCVPNAMSDCPGYRSSSRAHRLSLGVSCRILIEPLGQRDLDLTMFARYTCRNLQPVTSSPSPRRVGIVLHTSGSSHFRWIIGMYGTFGVCPSRAI